jgi:lipoprotein-anchoring transpeptidase ErfK/SrfK
MRRERRGYRLRASGYLKRVPLTSSGHGRGRLAPKAVATAIPAIVLVLVAGAVPASDLASPGRAGAARAVAKPSAAERYEAIRRRAAPVAILSRRTAVRAAPRAGARRLAALRLHTEWGSPTVLATSGRRGGWLRVIATDLPNGRRGWIPLSAVQLVPNPWRVRADLSSRTVTVYRHGRAVRRFHVAVGRPSTPTPTGRFAVTDKLNMSGNPAYGCCAMALSGHQTRIASGWSGGDRLAIHGTHLVSSIGTAASFGCLRALDQNARWLMNHVYLGTIVEIRR